MMKNGRKEGDEMKTLFVLPFYGPVAGFRNAPPGLHRCVVGSVAARAKNGFKPAHWYTRKRRHRESSLSLAAFFLVYTITPEQ
jgi:hypothetical protein